ncbi:hypothetical protein CF150_07351 [Pseudomonas sp. CF150]|nr:hypothetical protein CF150_07351 [Pseudomonas sp. CF150]
MNLLKSILVKTETMFLRFIETLQTLIYICLWKIVILTISLFSEKTIIEKLKILHKN